MRRRVATTCLAILLGSFVIGACGADDAGLSEQASTQLSQQVAALRSAASAGDGEGARAQVADLTDTVNRLVGEGQLSEGRAEEILAAAAGVDQDLALVTATTSLPTTSPPAPLPPPPPPSPDDQGEDHGKDDDDPGKGKGRDAD